MYYAEQSVLNYFVNIFFVFSGGQGDEESSSRTDTSEFYISNDIGFNSTLINVPNHSPDAGFLGACACRLDEHTVVLMGGLDKSDNMIDKINAYHVKTGQWKTLPYSTGMYRT